MSIKKAANSVLVSTAVLMAVVMAALPSAGNDNLQPAASEHNKLLEKINNNHRNVQAIQAVVHQERKISALKKTVRINGKVILKKPGMLRWETDTPEKSVTVIDGKTITRYYPEAGEAEIHALSDDVIANNTMTFFSTVMWGALDGMDDNFTVDVSTDNDMIEVELTPLSKIVSRYLSYIRIYYREETGMPQGFEIETPKGDKTVTSLSDIIIDPDVRDDAFTLKMPADVYIRDYTQKIDFN